MQRFKVKLPEWWTEGKGFNAFTDKVDTFCCDSTPTWFVTVYKNRHLVYAGYFKKSDLS